jgi:hypothetical protein
LQIEPVQVENASLKEQLEELKLKATQDKIHTGINSSVSNIWILI